VLPVINTGPNRVAAGRGGRTLKEVALYLGLPAEFNHLDLRMFESWKEFEAQNPP
jgi:hypothetical protein